MTCRLSQEIVNGLLTTVNGPLTIVNGLLTTVNGPLTIVNGPLTIVNGPLTIVNGLLTIVNGFITIVNGFITIVNGFIFGYLVAITMTQFPSSLLYLIIIVPKNKGIRGGYVFDTVLLREPEKIRVYHSFVIKKNPHSVLP
jgi:hypothetical protein